MSLITNNNGITLRTEKEVSLTFNEMDQNFSSFFYSASTVSAGSTNKLRLHYTGSNELDSGFNADRYMEVLLPKTPESSPAEAVSVPGSNTQIIFNCNDSFAASADLVFKNKRLGLGLSEPTAPIHVTKTSTGVDTQIRIEPNNSGNTSSTRAYYSIGIGNTTFLKLGKTSAGSGEETKCMHLFTNKPLEIGFSNFNDTTCRKIRVTSQGVAIGECISSNAVSPLSIQSTTTGAALSIGSNFNSDNRNSIGSLNVHTNKLPGSNTQGLLIQSPVGPNGGNVVIGVNSNGSNNESFSVIRGCQNDFATTSCANCSIATFKADGNVGIGKIDPQGKLHVEGNITGSGNITTEGNLLIKGTAAVETINAGSAASTSALVTTTAGIVQKIAAAPVPKGGIIMWSGHTGNIPDGWRLCDGNDGNQVNGVDIPDLTDKFVIGASRSYQNNAVTTVKGTTLECISQTGGTTTISRDQCCKLEECHIPSHNHTKSNGDPFGRCSKFLTSFQVGPHVDSPPFSTMSAFSGMNNSAGQKFGSMSGITSGGGTDCSIGDSQCPEMIIRTSYSCLACAQIQTFGRHADYQCSINLGFTINNHLPPYYSLAFIIYVGV